jgi:hypothetical protein
MRLTGASTHSRPVTRFDSSIRTLKPDENFIKMPVGVPNLRSSAPLRWFQPVFNEELSGR